MPGKELALQREQAKRQREEESHHEAIFDQEMAKRARQVTPTTSVIEQPEYEEEEAEDQHGPVTLADRVYGWQEESTSEEFTHIRDDFAVDMESLLKPGEPLIPVKCWACTMTESNSPFAVLEKVWQDFQKSVREAMATVGSIRYMGQQLYEIFHNDVVIVVRKSTDPDVAYEILGKPDEEVWSAYCIMHHFLVHAMDPETFQWLLIKRYQGLLHKQLTNSVVLRHRHSGREKVDPKGMAVADSLVESIKKVYSWDVKKMAFSDNKKELPPNLFKLASGRATYTNNGLRKPSGGRLKPW